MRRLLLLLLFPALTSAEPVVLKGADLAVGLDPDQGYAVTSLTHLGQDHELLGDAGERDLWQLTVREPGGQVHLLGPGDAAGVEPRQEGERLTLVWRQVGSDACPADLTVTVTVALRGGDTAVWRIAVTGTAPGNLWQVDFPRITGVAAIGDDRLAIPHYLGRLVRQPASQPWRATWDYPQPLSMQWFAFWGSPERVGPAEEPVESGAVELGWEADRRDDVGLYWAAEDGQGNLKHFGFDSTAGAGRFNWWLEQIPPLDQWPPPPGNLPVDYRQPYDIVTATFTGDYHEAAARYQKWASQQVWCARGAADTWAADVPEDADARVRWIPPWFREVGFWAKFYQEPAKVLPEWAAYQKWLQVPMASHYYRHPIARFDDNYPEHLPADPYFLEGLRDARAIGVQPLPYVQGSIWDTDTQSWIREDGFAGALKDELGRIYPWDIANEILAWMCPYTAQWQDKMAETGREMILDHGTSGIYLDVLVAGRPRPCYDPSHGHPIRGGNHYGQGNRRLLWELRRKTRAKDPDASFFSEECGELYLDVLDGHLTLDQSRSAPRPGEQVFPLFNVVYNPYTIDFGNDAQLGQDPDHFAWQMGQMLVWGTKPLNSSPVAQPPAPGDPAAEYLREVAQAYYTAGQRFLMGGQAERMVQLPAGSDVGDAPLAVTSAPTRVRYQQFGNRVRTWQGPAVMSSAWRYAEGLGLVLTNITGSDQPVELTLRADALGLDGATLHQLWPGTETLAGGPVHRLTLPPRSVRILVLSTGTPAANKPLLDPAWELQTQQDGVYPPVTGDRASLWACTDGPVENRVAATGTSAQALWLDESGVLSPREGHRPSAQGAAVEGHGLPRADRDQPFLLLRRLPHTAVGGEVLVWSGDRDQLAALVTGGAELTFATPGLVIVRNAATGEIVRAVTAETTDRLELPAAQPYLVGYASLDILRPHLALPGGVLELAELVGPLRELTSGLPAQRQEALAAASRASAALVVSLPDQPGELLPNRPLGRLNSALQALLTAQFGWRPVLLPGHDWLAPGVPKEVALTAWRPGAATAPAAINIRPVTLWANETIGQEVSRRSGNLLDSLPIRHTFRPQGGVEQVAPVVAIAEVAADRQSYALVDVTLLEANRPVELRVQALPLTAVGGRQATGEAVLRNGSPYDLTMTLTAVGPPGWQVTPEPAEVTVPALKDVTVPIAVTPAADAPSGAYELLVTANHSAASSTSLAGMIQVNLSAPLVPVQPGEVSWQPPDEANLARYRRESTLAIYAAQGETIRVAIDNVRVTSYTNALVYTLRDADLKPIREGRIPVDESAAVELAVPETGSYYLSLVPGSGSARVRVENRAVAELATEQMPLQLFTSPITRYFHVPAGAKQFHLAWNDGGPDETADFTITSPTGREALKVGGNNHGLPYPVTVQPDETDGIWTLRVVPRQDVDIWLGGDVDPYLSTAPERVLREAGRR